MSALILTLDVGTSSLRTMLYDAQGSALPNVEVQITHSVNVTPDGGVELDPEVLFANAVRAIDGILPRVPPGQTIAGVATCTVWHRVLGVDGNGAAITPLYTWADTRARAAAAELRTRLDQDAVHARTGCFLHPSYLPARLLWLSGARPETWRRAARWVSPRRIALMVGTSGALRVVVETPDAPVVPGLWWYRVDRRRPLLGGALSEGGNLVAWMRATLQLDALPDLEAEIAAMAPDAHGLTVLPFLAGGGPPRRGGPARGGGRRP